MIDLALEIPLVNDNAEPGLCPAEINWTNCEGLSDNRYTEIIVVSVFVGVITALIIGFTFSLFWGLAGGMMIFVFGLLFATERYEQSPECKTSQANKAKLNYLVDNLQSIRFEPIFYNYHKQALDETHHTPEATITWMYNEILYSQTLPVRQLTYMGMGGKTTVFFPNAHYTVVKNKVVIDWGTANVHYHTPSTLGNFLPCD